MTIFLRRAITLAVFFGFLTGCTQVETSAKAQPASKTKEDPNVIAPDAVAGQPLKIGKLKVLSTGDVLTVAARVEIDGTRITRIGSPVMGRVTALQVQEGQQVEPGQALAQVSSTLLSDGQLTFLRELSRGQVAQRSVERARVLLKAEVIGAAELQRREAELADAEVGRDAARDQLILLGLSPEALERLEKHRRIDSTARISATMRGTVLARRVTLGQVVQPADPIFEIADLSSLWLVADVPTSEAGGLFIGQSVEASIGSPAVSRVVGKISFVSSTVNDETRTVRARMELDNSTGRFKPAMLAEMRLRGRTEARACVPAAAVVREEDQDHVFVQTKPGALTLRPVKLGEEYGDCRVLLGGVDLREDVVIEGAFHLNNERRRRALRASEGE